MQSLQLPEFSAEELTYVEEYNKRELATNSLHEFARQAWSHVEGDIPFIDGWHIGAICEHLEAVVRREIRNLLILIPPRCMKSTLVSVMWPAWVWIHAPQERFLFTSYAASLSRRDSLGCRRLIMSEWYQARWGDRYKLRKDQNTKGRFDNDMNGYRLATSVMGSSTGEGGSFLVFDDANNAKDGESEVKREGTNDWWSQVMSTRLNDPKKGCKVGVQQRLHERDLAGYIMENDVYKQWTRLILPMEFEGSRKAKTIILPSTKGKIWEDPRTKEGELLWEPRIGKHELKVLKAELRTEYRIAGQLQQRPAPASGGIIKKSWFKWWKEERPPKLIQIIQSWDTALETNETNSYSACTTWGYFYDIHKVPCIILLALWRGRVEYPDLRKLARNLFEDYRNDGTREITPNVHHASDIVLVEAKASGISLIQDFRRGGINAFKFDPTPYGDKTQRVRVASVYIEEGQVFVPALGPSYTSLTPISHTLLELCSTFGPDVGARDVVDTMSQVILRLASNGLLTHRKDPKHLEGASSRAKGAFYDDY
jgi:phage terminase large subunit-like protein